MQLIGKGVYLGERENKEHLTLEEYAGFDRLDQMTQQEEEAFWAEFEEYTKNKE